MLLLVVIMPASAPGIASCARARPLPQSAVPANIEMAIAVRSDEHTSELQSLMRISYAVFCLKKHNANFYMSTLFIVLFFSSGLQLDDTIEDIALAACSSKPTDE